MKKSTTVIIPTLYRCPSILEKTLLRLRDQNCSTHLIDNSSTNSCKRFETWRGVRISYFPANMGVNPAWNLGVAAATTPYYVILNDDCVIWNNLIETVEKALEHESIGIVSFDTKTEINETIYDSMFINQNNPSEFKEMGPGHGVDKQGWIFAGRKSEYPVIPQTLKILFGDDWIFNHIRREKRTVIDQNNSVFHRVSHTIGSVYNQRQYNQLFQRERDLYVKEVERDGRL